MAKRLEAGLQGLAKIKIAHEVETNSVFAAIPDEIVQRTYQRGWKFYTHVGAQGEARLMCSWDTTEQDVDEFVHDLRACTTMS